MSDTSDMLALANNIRNSDGMCGSGSGWLWWILIIFFLFSGGGFGNNAAQNALTRAEMQDGFNNQNIVNALSGMSNQINTGVDGITLGMNNGFNGVNQNICNLGYQMAQNCCELKNAIHADGEATRALLTQNEIQSLRDKIQEKDLELAQSNILSINQNQTNSLQNFMRQLCNGCGCSC